jgi:hypothetical protein
MQTVQKIAPDSDFRLVCVQMAWPRIAVPSIEYVAWPARIHQDRLTLHVLDNQWLHELSYMRFDLLQRVQEQCRECKIADVRFVVGPVPAPTSAARKIPELRFELPAEPSVDTLDALRSIGDNELRHAMANARQALGLRSRG